MRAPEPRRGTPSREQRRVEAQEKQPLENPRGGRSTRREEDEHQRNAPGCDASQVIQETGVELASQIIKLLLGILMGIREIKSVFHKGGVMYVCRRCICWTGS